MKHLIHTQQINYAADSRSNFVQKLMNAYKIKWSPLIFATYIFCMAVAGCFLGILCIEFLKLLK